MSLQVAGGQKREVKLLKTIGLKQNAKKNKENGYLITEVKGNRQYKRSKMIN